MLQDRIFNDEYLNLHKRTFNKQDPRKFGAMDKYAYICHVSQSAQSQA